MLLLIVLGRGVAFAQFNPTNPPDPDMPVVYRNISVSATPNGAANVSGAGKYAEGKSVSIRTSANTSYKFQYWTKNGEKYSESTSFNYTVGKEDVNFVAVYKFDPANPQDPETDKRYELYLSSSPEGCCSFNRTSGEKIEAGQSVHVNVYSNQGFQFLGWYNGETLVSSSKSFYFTMPEKRTTLVAKFVYNPTLPEDPSNDGDQSDIDPGTPGAVTGISLDKTLLYLPVGDSYTLNATVSPDDATDKTVTWSTSDASVATVANGVVKGIKEGKAVITAKAGSKTVTCDVNVIIPVTSVTLDKSSYDLSLGESFTLTASVLPDNATDKTVTWSSSNTSVAKVENGVVTSCGLGEAIITAKSGDKMTSCNVRVIIPVSGVTLNLSTAEMLVGESLALKAEVAPSNATDKVLTWSSSDATIATVDNNGVVKALKAGKVTITAKAGEKIATCEVIVNPVPVSGITLDKTSVELLEGETITLKATVSPDNATDKTVVWSTSDASIATVDNKGVVKAIKVGKVTITAKAGDKTATCEVTVKTVPVSGIVLDKTSVELLEGETITLKATVSPDNATDKTVTWSTSDATIATVDNNGVVKAINVGKVIITAKAGDKTATCEVTVKPVPVSGIVLDKTSVELLEGETTTLKATVSPDNATDKTVAWSTSDASIATVDNNGVVKAIKVGKVTITAKAGDKTATCEVTVKPVPVSGIVLDKTTIELLEGETTTLKATVEPSNATDKTVTWSTSDASIATVDNNGVVKAIKVGKVTITAKAGDKTATCEVTVKPVPVSGIVLDKISVELFEGETITLTATVSPDNATDKTVTWSTSDASIATVDNNGVVKAIKVGKVTITAKAGDKTATCDVTVKPVLVSGITLDKTSVELLEGGTVTLKATVEPSNATDKTVTWSTLDASIATVDNNGVVKAIKVGKVTITAKAGDKTATCEVTVKPVPVSGIVLEKTTIELLEGETTTLKVTVAPDNATDKTVTWSTSDASIATVDNNGVVKAIKVGKVTITAKAGDKTATCDVTVNPVPVDGIVLDKTEVELLEGDSITLTATVSPDNATDKTVTWSTSDATIATVDNNGVVKAIKVGVVTITAKAGDKTAACEVTVKPNDVGIDDVNVTVNVLNGDIYTIRGIKVRNAGESLEGLAKGVYIKNGKKFLVK